ncbi:MAG: riboflavin synthase, partial [Bacteroidetes bacterium]|nr:riboflavin synthase [Bacteroidota bacterium]
MFTGIIECMGKITAIEHEHTNVHLTVESPISNELKIDQSVAHNGVCLTVVELGANSHKVTAIQETMSITNLGDLKVGDWVNLERCMPANGRFDGHIVQGHVDGVAVCTQIIDENGSWKYHFTYNFPGMTVKKGSITVNGTSLTVVDSEDNAFSVAIIPYTYEHTVFKFLKVGDRVNIEWDIIGKYVE